MEDTIRELTKKIEENPTVESYFKRGWTYFNVNKYDLALCDFERGLEHEPLHKDCYYMRIYTLAKLKHYDEALNECERTILKHPDYAPAYCGKGAVYVAQKEYDEALVNYNKAIELDPNNAYAYNGRGIVYYNQNRFDEALAEYNKAIELDPNYANAYNGRGNVYHNQNRYDEALAEYNKAIKLDPKFTDVYYNRGNVYLNQNRYDKALAEYNKAIELDPNFAHAFYNRGIVYYNQNRFDEALADYKKARDLYKKEKKDYDESTAKNKIDEVNEIIRISKEKEKDDARIIIEKTEELAKKIKDNEERGNNFYKYNPPKKSDENYFTFTVLRKWNSFTPIVGRGFRSSKGGGYFIKTGDKGIVIDPGFNFIENFMTNGYTFSEIDAVFITHAHNDHTADLDSLLTMLHKYNDDLYGGELNDPNFEPKKGSVLDKAMSKFNYTAEMLHKDPQKMKNVKDEMDKRFPEVVKNITFYITTGTFKKYAGFFNLKKISNYKIVCIDSEHYEDKDSEPIIKIGDVGVKVIKAKHDDIISDSTAVGFCFEQGDFVLIYTGDTGFWDMQEEYKKLADRYSEKSITLVANIGGFKRSEMSYSQNNDIEKHYYKNHLGRLGLAKLAEIIKPKLCIISEFGSEFDGGHRRKIADIFNSVYNGKIGTYFLPADIGLHVNKCEVEVIMSCENMEAKKFVDPSAVSVIEVKPTSQLYYHHNDVDAEELRDIKIEEFYKSSK